MSLYCYTIPFLQKVSENLQLDPRKMSLGTPEIQFLGPMMLPNLNYGIENRPEQTSEYSLGDRKCSLGVLSNHGSFKVWGGESSVCYWTGTPTLAADAV